MRFLMDYFERWLVIMKKLVGALILTVLLLIFVGGYATGTGEYEIVADKDKKIFYVNGWPDKAYADLNRARTNEKEGDMQWTLWRDTVQTNCETLRDYMDEKGYDDWGCSWSIRSNRNHGTVFLTVFDGNVLFDELEHQK